jgi:hypothetical protein
MQNPQGLQLVAQIWSQVHTVQYCTLRLGTESTLLILLTQFVAQIQSPNLRNRDAILEVIFSRGFWA